MKRKKIQSNKTIAVNNCIEGFTIEQKMEKIRANKEKIEDYDEKPKLYNERREGIISSQNIRGDALDISRVAMSKKTEGNIYRRTKRAEEALKISEEKNNTSE